MIPSFNKFNTSNKNYINTNIKPKIFTNNIFDNNKNPNLNLTNTDFISNYNKKSQFCESKIISDNKVDNDNNESAIREQFIPYNEYEKPNAYFNNFNNNGKINFIKEYFCNISSIDRDIKKYPDPFNFLIRLQSNSDSNDAIINHDFKNIKSFKINNIIVPRKYYLYKKQITNYEIMINLFDQELNNNQIINDEQENETWVIIYKTDNTINYTKYIAEPNDYDKSELNSVYELKKMNNEYITYEYKLLDKTLDLNKYILIYINDLNNINEYSTNNNLSTAFNILTPELITRDYLYLDNKSVEKIYEISNLGNLSRMQISFKNSLDKYITINTKVIDYNVPNIDDKICTCTYDEFNNIIRNYSCICNYIRHPRFIKIQNDIMFKFGIMETDFDKRVFN